MPDHPLKTVESTKVWCCRCQAVVPAASTCQNCGNRFALYFCSKCHHYDGTPFSKCFHCEQCLLLPKLLAYSFISGGICRRGTREESVHCNECGTCVKASLYPTHRHFPNILNEKCPICFQLFSDHSDDIYVPTCGHCLHKHCALDMLPHGSLICPICRRPLFPFPATSETLSHLQDTARHFFVRGQSSHRRRQTGVSRTRLAASPQPQPTAPEPPPPLAPVPQ